MTPPEIEFIIDLDSTREAFAFPLGKSNLHLPQLQKAVRCISEAFARIPEKESAASSNHPILRVHETIAVFGKRGVGKTSFLLSLLHADAESFSTEPSQPQVAARTLFEELQPLPIIDPTLMGRKENLLHLIVGSIKAQIDKHLITHYDDCNDEQSLQLTENWAKSYRKLGQGIAEVELLQGPRREWYDAAITFETSITAIEHGVELESEFKNFIELSLQVLEKKAFLVFLDDIDTRPEVCWPILECVRKYFTTPRLITFISGDLELYSAIVRNNMLAQFFPGAASHSLDERQSELLEDLVEQYLMKIIPSRNRITLLDFYTCAVQLMDEMSMYDKVFFKRTTSKIPLKYWLQGFHKALGLHYPNLMQRYNRALFSIPLRTFRQLCDAILDAFNNHIDIGKKDRLICYHTLMRSLADIFQSPLLRFGYADYRLDLETLATPAGIGNLLDKLVMNRLFQTRDDLAPEGGSYAMRMTFVVIQAYLTAGFLKNPGTALHYLLKISMLKQVTQFAGYELDSMETYRPIRDYIRLETEARLYNTGQCISSISWSAPGQQEGALSSQPYRYGSVMVTMPRNLGLLTKKAISILHPTELAGKNGFLISIFSFIGLIGDFLGADNNFKRDELVGSLRNDNTLFPFRTATHTQLSAKPNSIHTSSIVPATETFDSFYSERMLDVLRLWQASIAEFLEDPNTDTISAEIFSAIAKRFDDGLRELDYIFAPHEKSVQDYLKQCAVLFLNAVLVEESLRVQEPDKLDFTSPVQFSAVLYENILTCMDKNRIKKGTALNQSYPLFSIVASFPLWGIFNLQGDIENYSIPKEISDGLRMMFPLFTSLIAKTKNDSRPHSVKTFLPHEMHSSYLKSTAEFPWKTLRFV